MGALIEILLAISYFQHLPSFVHWMFSEGFPISNGIAFTEGEFGVQTVCTEALASDGMLIACPERFLMASSLLMTAPNNLLENEKLVLVLLQERHKGESSKWFDYIKMLPKLYGSVYWMTPQVRALLEGTYSETVANSELTYFEKLVETVHKQPSCSEFSREDIKWAYGTVRARAYMIGRSSSRPSSLPHFRDVPFLAPGTDLFNHHHEAEVLLCYKIALKHCFQHSWGLLQLFQ